MSTTQEETARRLKDGRLQLPWTQDLKKIFFNDGVLRALEYAFRNDLFPIEKTSLEYAQIQRAYWLVEGRLQRFIDSSAAPLSKRCAGCSHRERCSDEYVPCLGRSSLFYGNEYRVMSTFAAKYRYALKVAILYAMNIFLGSALIWALCIR